MFGVLRGFDVPEILVLAVTTAFVVFSFAYLF
jgi:hypothetical protein